MLGGTLWMLPHGRMHDFGTVPWFLVGAGLMLLGFFVALRFPPRAAWMFWGVALGTRAVLLFQTPGDDIYRYVWEGRLLLGGWNPYLHAPDASVLMPLRDELWSSVQHRSFTAIYPPLAEWLMAGLARIWATPMFFKGAFAVADVAVLWLLDRRFGRPRSLVYAWNPLVIYSFAGGGHYDSFFLLALVLGWFAWRDGHRLQAVFHLGVAVALKWMALPLLAWAGWQMLREVRRPGGLRAVGFAAAIGALPLVLSFLAVGLWTGEWTLQLFPARFSQYARSAEFLPGIVGFFWESSRFHNQWFIIPLAVGWLVVILGGRDITRTAEWLFFLALVLTPMLHAWYFTWLMPLAVATRNRGSLAVTASSFVYFMLYHHVEAPQGAWKLSPWETGFLWLPLVIGFVYSAWRRQEPGDRAER
ncbi:MAG: hypothetical protein SNJ84_06025 [Verrucomicrobiia bacterium]